MTSRPLPVVEVADVARVPLPARPAAVLFGHAGFAYGHAARCHKIARHLVQRCRFEAYVVSSYPELDWGESLEGLHHVVFPGFRLPSPDVLPESPPIVDRVSSLPGVPDDAFSAHRGRLLRALVARLRPRAVLLEGFPFVRPTQALEECGPALAHLARESPGALRCAGFNGVPTGLYATDQAPLIERVLRDAVDRLLVYVEPGERSALFERCPYLETVESKIRFMGYVVGPRPAPGAGGTRILATFGGASTPTARSCWWRRRSWRWPHAAPAGRWTWSPAASSRRAGTGGS